jgi:hypothetical protein
MAGTYVVPSGGALLITADSKAMSGRHKASGEHSVAVQKSANEGAAE